MTPGVFLRTRCISVPSQSLVFLALAFSTILLAWTSCASAQIRFVPKTLVVRANGNPWNQIDVEFAVDTRIPNPDGTSGVFRPFFWRIKASMGSTTIWDQSSGGPEVDDHKIAKSFTVKNEGDYSVDISAWLADSGECARGTICNSVSEKAKAGIAKKRGQIRGLLIGINAYQRPAAELKFAENDARALKEFLDKVLGAPEITSLLSPEATKDGMYTALRRLVQSARQEDMVVILYSGHGMRIGDSFYLVPQNAQKDNETGEWKIELLIDVGELWDKFLRRIKAERVVVLVDSCFAGSVNGIVQTHVRGILADTDVLGDKPVWEKFRTKSLHIYAAAGEKQVAREVYLDKQGQPHIVGDGSLAGEKAKGHGLFTFSLLTGIEQALGATSGRIGVDLNNDGFCDHIDCLPDQSSAAAVMKETGAKVQLDAVYDKLVETMATLQGGIPVEFKQEAQRTVEEKGSLVLVHNERLQ